MSVALLWPNSYETGMASLGFLWAYESFNRRGDVTCERAFAGEPTWKPGQQPRSFERNRPISTFDLIAVSISYELDLLNLIQLLLDAGIPPLAGERHPSDPPVVIGGPLTRANSEVLLAFADVVVRGDGEEAMGGMQNLLISQTLDKAEFIAGVSGLAGVLTGDNPDGGPCNSPASVLPVNAPLYTPNSSLPGLHLVEVSRGCPKACTFCLGRAENSPLRLATFEDIVSGLPDKAPGIGIIGAALGFHPQLKQIIEWAAQREKTVGISSLRAERTDRETVELLRKTGSEVLTVAADGASARLRQEICKDIDKDDLIRCAELARDCDLHAMKLYLMVGLPGENQEDLEEFADLANELNCIIPLLVSLSIFVPKKDTPLEQAPFGPANEVSRRIKTLYRESSGGIRYGRISPKEAAIQCLISQASAADGPALVRAASRGGKLAHFRNEFPDRVGTLTRT